MRLRPALRAVVVGIVVALPVSADAPPGQYDKFYSADRRIRDLKAGLVWERSVSPAPVEFANATCPAGRRLPTLKELLTLVDEDPHLEYDGTLLKNVPKMIDTAAFGKETPVDYPYWTSSRGDIAKIWTVDFGTGETDLTRDTDRRYVRCVQFLP
jgi:hypothetical protein